MYCKTCGHNNLESANYCVNDGKLLNQVNHKYKSSGQAQFCPGCGQQSSDSQSYCGSCGQTLLKFSKDKGVPIPISIPKIETQAIKNAASSIKVPAFSLANLKSVIIPVIVSFAILFIFAYFMADKMKDSMNELLSEQLGDMDINYMIEMIEEEAEEDAPELDKLIGLTDYVMMSNMQGSTFKMEIEGDMYGEEGEAKGELEIQYGSIILLLIAFVALFIGGIVMGKMNKGNALLPSAITFAVCYGVILSILSFFSGFKYKNRIDDGEYIDISVNFANNYSFIESLLSGLVIAFIFAGLGMLFALNFRKVTGNLRDLTVYGEALHQSFSTIVRGGVILFAGLFAILYSKFEEVKDDIIDLSYYIELPIGELIEKSTMFISLLSVQLSNYVWNLLHFSPLTFNATGDGETGKVTFSAFSGFDASGAARGSGFKAFESFASEAMSDANIDLYLKLAVIIPIALLVWAGYQIAKTSNQGLTPLIVFSISYAFLMAILASFSNIGLGMELRATGEEFERTSMSIGFPVIRLFISSFILSFVCAYGGTWLRKYRA